MLHGRVVRSRGQAALGQGASVLSIDKRSIAHIPNVQVVKKGNFVGVIAPLEWDAILAAYALKVLWSSKPELPGYGNLESALRDPAKLQAPNVAADTGDAEAARAHPGKAGA